MTLLWKAFTTNRCKIKTLEIILDPNRWKVLECCELLMMNSFCSLSCLILIFLYWISCFSHAFKELGLWLFWWRLSRLLVLAALRCFSAFLVGGLVCPACLLVAGGCGDGWHGICVDLAWGVGILVHLSDALHLLNMILTSFVTNFLCPCMQPMEQRSMLYFL